MRRPSQGAAAAWGQRGAAPMAAMRAAPRGARRQCSPVGGAGGEEQGGMEHRGLDFERLDPMIIIDDCTNLKALEVKLNFFSKDA